MYVILFVFKNKFFVVKNEFVSFFIEFWLVRMLDICILLDFVIDFDSFCNLVGFVGLENVFGCWIFIDLGW